MKFFDGFRYIPLLKLAREAIGTDFRRKIIVGNGVALEISIRELSEYEKNSHISIWFKKDSWRDAIEHLLVSQLPNGKNLHHNMKVPPAFLGPITSGLIKLEILFLLLKNPCCSKYKNILNNPFDFSTKFCQWCGSPRSFEKEKIKIRKNRFEQIVEKSYGNV